MAFGAFLLALGGCGGGGGGGGSTPTQPQPPQSSLVFTPGASSGSGIALASGTGSGPTTLVLEVRANSVQNLYGVAFDLSFPASLLRLDASTRGSFLGDESNTTLALVQPTPGNLVIGLSRLGTLPGVSGSGTLLTLRFTALASGSGSFAFARNSAVDAAGSPLSGLAWSGGSVQVTVVPAL